MAVGPCTRVWVGDLRDYLASLSLAIVQQVAQHAQHLVLAAEIGEFVTP